MIEYSVLVYRTRNLGDVVQTLALTRLLPQTWGVYRHQLADAPADRLLILNGLLDKDPAPRPGTVPCLFAGVSGPHFRQREYRRWMATSPYPIGARDPHTMRWLAEAGREAVLVGCATLTFNRYEGPRRGVYSVDYAGPGEQLTHAIAREPAAAPQWDLAAKHLDRYRTAEAVYTTRLHVALPCLAFGTPVWIANPKRRAWRPERFSLLDELGVDYETLVTADVTPMARRYLQFLEQHLAHAIDPNEPKMPHTPPDSGYPRWRLPWR